MKIYQIDAFTNRLFGGNPAAVIPLQQWLPDYQLQAIASENNLSETAFYVPLKEGFELRWFTPTTEVALCGHATLATAHVLFEEEGYLADAIEFHSKYSGILRVNKTEDGITMDFPCDEIYPLKLTDAMRAAFLPAPIKAYQGKSDILLIFESEACIQNLEVAMAKVEEIECRGIIATAPGKTVDFVSRFFGPRVGVPEDPVTGSAHTTLVPYWYYKTKKSKFAAKQLSQRGGELFCELKGERVYISGRAVTYLKGEIKLANGVQMHN